MKDETGPQEPCCHTGLRERLLHALVQPVPDGLALCEFDCSRTECSVDEWRHCKRRLEALNPSGES
jgi:hypothetical protein